MPCKSLPSTLLDRFGMAWATVCAVHCLALPLAFVVFPALSMALYSFHDPNHAIAIGVLRLITFEPWFIVFATFVAGSACAFGAWRHRHWLPSLCAVAGILSLSLGYRFAGLWDGWLHPFGMISGAGCLVAAHTINLRYLARLPQASLREST
jgi:asparagine N-glycosylation enzyme membrane subunit Stt3